MQLLVDSALDFWLTTGRFAEEFEERFAPIMGARPCYLLQLGIVGEPARARLAHVAAARRPRAAARRRGDHLRVGFPTTVTPVYQHGLVPVYVDVDLKTYNVDANALADAVGPKTKAIMLAHTLGNPFDLGAISELCERHGLWLVEDTCDAVGATYGGKPVGSFGSRRDRQLLPRSPRDDGRGRLRARLGARSSSASSSRCATGAATAGARRASRTPAAGASAGSSATSPTATTTSTSTRTSGTT